MKHLPFLLVCVLAPCGCQSSSGVGEVVGAVHMNGQPLDDISVQFWPVGEVKEPAGTAFTDAEGVFVFDPEINKKYAKPGSYIVVLRDMKVLKDPDIRKKDLPREEKKPKPPRFAAEFSDRHKKSIAIELKSGKNKLSPFAVTPYVAPSEPAE